MKCFEGFQKGVNLGGWISQFAKYDHNHFRTFITREDIAYIASLGFDHVRLPVDYNVLEDEDGNELEFEMGAVIPYEEKQYVVLLPLAEDDNGIVILELQESEDEEGDLYLDVEDEAVLDAVFNIFKEAYKEEYDFID